MMEANEGGYGWVVVFAGFVLDFLEAGTIKSFGVFLEVVIADLNTSQSVVGFAFGLCYGLSYFLGCVWSMVYAPNRLRLFLIASSLLVTVSLALISVCYNVVPFTLLLVAAGVGYSVWPFWMTVALQGYFPRRFSLAYGLKTTGRGAGMVIIPIVAARFLEIYGWRGAFLILAGVNLHAMAVSAFTRSAEEQGMGTTTSRRCLKGARTHQMETGATEDKDVRSHLEGGPHCSYQSIELMKVPEVAGSSQSTYTDRQTSNKPPLTAKRVYDVVCNKLKEYLMLFPILVTGLMLGMSASGVIIFLVPNAVDKGVKLSHAIILSSVFGLGDLIGRPLNGLIHVKTQWNAIRIVLGVTLFYSGTFFLFPFSHSFAMLIVNAFFNGGCMGAINVLNIACLHEVLPKHLFENAVGFYYLSFGIGAPLGGLLAGKFKIWTSTYDYAFVFFGVVEVISSLFLLLALKLDSKRRQGIEDQVTDRIPIIGSSSNTGD